MAQSGHGGLSVSVVAVTTPPPDHAAASASAVMDDDVSSPSSRHALIDSLAQHSPPMAQRALLSADHNGGSDVVNGSGSDPNSDTNGTENGTAIAPAASSSPRVQLQLSEAEGRDVLRRVSWRLLPFISVLYCLCFLDRANIANGHGSLLADLQIGDDQYADAVAIFFAGYCLCEVPSNLLMKKVPANVWIARIMLLWGVCSCCLAAVHTYAGLLVVRLCLGAAEAGFFPGMVFYLSCWFRPDELSYPIAYFFSSSAVAGCVGGVVAYGLLQLDGSSGLRGWQILFLAEGLPSVVVGISVYWLLPPGPTHPSVTWLSEREKQWVVQRLPKAAGDTHIAWADIRTTLLNGDVWLFCAQNFCTITILYSLSFFMPALVASFGYSTLTSNLLSAPVYAVALVVTVAVARACDRAGATHRWRFLIWPCVGAGVSFLLQGIAMHTGNTGFQYFCLLLSTAQAWSVVAVTLALLTRLLHDITAHSTTGAAVGTALVVAVGNVGGVVGPKILGASVSRTGSYADAMWALGALMLCGAACAVWLQRRLAYQSDLQHLKSAAEAMATATPPSDASTGAVGVSVANGQSPPPPPPPPPPHQHSDDIGLVPTSQRPQPPDTDPL